MDQQLVPTTPAGPAGKLLDGLDPEQQEVALHDRGPCLVVASAGAGKTRSIVHRLSYLVAARGISPARILCLTFTKKAAGEMASRAAKLLGDSNATVHTFHALCMRILSADWPGFSSWTLDGAARESEDDEEGPRKIRITYRHLVKDAVGFRGLKWERADVEELIALIELCKAAGARPESREARAIALLRFNAKPSAARDVTLSLAAYKLAENLRVQQRLMTFSDWMVETKELLEKNEDVRVRWAAKFDYVMVDEGQDNCLVQTRIAEHLARDHRNLMLIGDSGQAIHEWRGAAPAIFDAFATDWNARVIKLDRNYRSTKAVIDISNIARGQLLQSNATRFSARGQRDDPGVVRVRQYGTQNDEARGVASTIMELHAAGTPLREMFVLYRTNALSRAPEEALCEASIPYVVIGGSSFYMRKEVRALCSYLRLATPGRAQLDDVRRALREPNRFLSKAFLDAVETNIKRASPGPDVTPASIVAHTTTQFALSGSQRSAVAKWGALVTGLREVVTDAQRAHQAIQALGPAPTRDLLAEDPTDNAAYEAYRAQTSGLQEQVQRASPADLLRCIANETGFLAWLEQDEGRDSVENDRKTNVAELIRAAELFTSSADLLTHIDQQLAARTKSRKEDGKDRVTLMTIHAAKGLEAKHVFVIMLNDGVLPHAKAENLEEEKRLAYVALSRAKDELHISYIQIAPSLSGKIREVAPSPFIPRELLDHESRRR